MKSNPHPVSAHATADRPQLKIFRPEPAMTDDATPAGSASVATLGAMPVDGAADAYPHSPLPAEGTAPAGFKPLVATPELLAELAEANARLEHAQPEEIIAWAAERFGSYLTMATAFGPEGSVIVSILADVAPDTYVFNLDTGYQFQETLDMRDRLASQVRHRSRHAQAGAVGGRLRSQARRSAIHDQRQAVLLRSQDRGAA